MISGKLQCNYKGCLAIGEFHERKQKNNLYFIYYYIYFSYYNYTLCEKEYADIS